MGAIKKALKLRLIKKLGPSFLGKGKKVLGVNLNFFGQKFLKREGIGIGGELRERGKGGFKKGILLKI